MQRLLLSCRHLKALAGKIVLWKFVAFRGRAVLIFVLLGHDAAPLEDWCPMFREGVVFSPSLERRPPITQSEGAKTQNKAILLILYVTVTAGPWRHWRKPRKISQDRHLSSKQSNPAPPKCDHWAVKSNELYIYHTVLDLNHWINAKAKLRDQVVNTKQLTNVHHWRSSVMNRMTK